jgi:hypothetical protein
MHLYRKIAHFSSIPVLYILVFPIPVQYIYTGIGQPYTTCSQRALLSWCKGILHGADQSTTLRSRGTTTMPDSMINAWNILHHETTPRQRSLLDEIYHINMTEYMQYTDMEFAARPIRLTCSVKMDSAPKKWV